jgi:putative membrane protein
VSSDNPGHPHLHWLADPLVLVPLALFAGIYVWRFAQARKEEGGRGAGLLQALAFAGGMLVVLAALVSPLDGLGEDYLFSAHMVQHVLLGDLAPLLILLALSRVILRPVTRRLTSVERRLGPLASPATGLIAWLVLMYLWHVPALYDAAVEHPLVHVLEHVSFFSVGLLYWWHLLSPIRSRHRLSAMGAVVYMVSTKLFVGLLGIALTFAPDALYEFYKQQPPIWGLNPSEDESLAGGLMALEQSIVMGIALVWLFIAALTEADAKDWRLERYSSSS